jgi:hypothetical protein
LLPPSSLVRLAVSCSLVLLAALLACSLALTLAGSLFYFASCFFLLSCSPISFVSSSYLSFRLFFFLLFSCSPGPYFPLALYPPTSTLLRSKPGPANSTTCLLLSKGLAHPFWLLARVYLFIFIRRSPLRSPEPAVQRSSSSSVSQSFVSFVRPSSPRRLRYQTVPRRPRSHHQNTPSLDRGADLPLPFPPHFSWDPVDGFLSLCERESPLGFFLLPVYVSPIAHIPTRP